MTKHALVIGAETRDLRGVVRDATRVRDLLADRGFRVEFRVNEDATREGILDGYRRLAGRLTAGCAAVVYFSGHGGLALNIRYASAAARGRWVPRYFQFIVPWDYEQRRPGDFRGILRQELAGALLGLTDRTRNVTLILDCCHSAQMSRAASIHHAQPRALPSPVHTGIEPVLDQLRAQGIDVDRVRIPQGNPWAVRLAASGQHQPAWEYKNARGEVVGVFTEALLWAFSEAGDVPVTWQTLGRVVRERVLRLMPEQRVELEGPVQRLTFATDEPRRTGALSVVPRNGSVVLRGGQIAGVSPGDVYGIVPMEVETPCERDLAARATVTKVTATVSETRLAFVGEHTSIPDDAKAVPMHRSTRRADVIVEAEESRRGAVLNALGRSELLSAVAAGQSPDAVATLRVCSGSLEVCDAAGPLLPSQAFSDTGLCEAVRLLENLAVAQRVRDLEGFCGMAAESVAIELGVVDGGGARPLDPHGGMLALGDRIYLRIHNRASTRRYFHVFNIGLRGEVTLLTRGAPSGVGVDGGDNYVLGVREGAGLVGMPLSWPQGLATDQPRRDELLTIATAVPADLRVLETADRVRGLARSVPSNALRRLLAQRRHGHTRNVTCDEDSDGFVARGLSFWLNPIPGQSVLPQDFAIDASPAAAYRPAPKTASARRAIRIRLARVHVGDVGKAAAGAVRLHSLLVTPAAKRDATVRAETLRFGIGDDGSAALANEASLYCGPVTRFAELYLWLSRDEVVSTSLASLLEGAADLEAFKRATASLVDAATSGSDWNPAIGAGAVLARLAFDALAQHSSRALGCFRTTLLADDDFGIGRHPAAGVYRAHDLSFALQVEEAAAEVSGIG